MGTPWEPHTGHMIKLTIWVYHYSPKFGRPAGLYFPFQFSNFNL